MLQREFSWSCPWCRQLTVVPCACFQVFLVWWRMWCTRRSSRSQSALVLRTGDPTTGTMAGPSGNSPMTFFLVIIKIYFSNWNMHATCSTWAPSNGVQRYTHKNALNERVLTFTSLASKVLDWFNLNAVTKVSIFILCYIFVLPVLSFAHSLTSLRGMPPTLEPVSGSSDGLVLLILRVTTFFQLNNIWEQFDIKKFSPLMLCQHRT